jgi:hypothetical protein
LYETGLASIALVDLAPESMELMTELIVYLNSGLIEWLELIEESELAAESIE